MAMVEVRDLRKSYGQLEVLKRLSFDVEHGDVVVVVGPSGSGKSTLLRCINFLDDFQEGEIRIDGETVGYPIEPDGRRARRSETENAKLREHVGIVFQSFNLFPHRTALQNVTMGRMHVRKMPKTAARELAQDLLTKVGLSEKADQYGGELYSGGLSSNYAPRMKALIGIGRGRRRVRPQGAAGLQ